MPSIRVLNVRIVAIGGRSLKQFGGRWLDEHAVFNHVSNMFEARLVQVAPKTNYKLNLV